MIRVARDLGYEVAETPIQIDEASAKIQSGQMTEVFACGTAAVVVGIRELVFESGKRLVIGDGGAGEITRKLNAELQGIQFGRIADKLPLDADTVGDAPFGQAEILSGALFRLKKISDCLTVDWDDVSVRIRVLDELSPNWNREFKWTDITAGLLPRRRGFRFQTCCFLIFPKDTRPAVFLTETDQGPEFFSELVRRNLFPRQIYNKAISSSDGGTYCWPPIESLRISVKDTTAARRAGAPVSILWSGHSWLHPPFSRQKKLDRRNRLSKTGLRQGGGAVFRDFFA